MIQVARTVDAPAARIWKIVTDTRLWPEWGPSVRAVAAPQRFIELGMKGRVKTVLGLWVAFSITDYVEGAYWRWKVARIPATGHRVEALGEQHARIVFEVPTFAAPYAGVCKIACARIARLAEAR